MNRRQDERHLLPDLTCRVPLREKGTKALAIRCLRQCVHCFASCMHLVQSALSTIVHNERNICPTERITLDERSEEWRASVGSVFPSLGHPVAGTPGRSCTSSLPPQDAARVGAMLAAQAEYTERRA
ncbi:MAG: hypothetical protein ABIH23_36335 [bacterium]